MITVISAIFVFSLVVIFHEFGHFIVAKLVGIRVHEFAVGMGPSIVKVKSGETEYSIRALPIGGYIKMEGEDEESQSERSYSQKHPVARMSVIFAGPVMNFILAIVVYSIITFLVGAPTTTISEVNNTLPAYEAGLKSGDKVISIDNHKIDNWDELVSRINEGNSDRINIVVLREGKNLSFNIKPTRENETNRIIIGITPTIEKSFFGSIKAGFEKTYFYLSMMVQFFIMLFKGKVSTGDLAGPVGVIHLVGEAAKLGIIPLLSLVGFISINLGFFNLLPIPALDGSRLMFSLIELVRGKPINPEREGFIHFIGFIFLLLLMIIISYKDIVRLNVF